MILNGTGADLVEALGRTFKGKESLRTIVALLSWKIATGTRKAAWLMESQPVTT